MVETQKPKVLLRVIEKVMQDKIRNKKMPIQNRHVSKLKKTFNSKDASGQYLTCHSCESPRYNNNNNNWSTGTLPLQVLASCQLIAFRY